jgi:hypothetical protein
MMQKHKTMKYTTTKHPSADCLDPMVDAAEQLCDVVHEAAQLGLNLLGGLAQLKGALLCAPLQVPKLFCSPLQLPKLCGLPLLQLPTLCGLPPLPLLSSLSSCLTPHTGHTAHTGCGCDIPPPCWMPRDLGEVETGVCPGETATIRIHVTNCGATARTIKLEGGPGVTLNPASLTLGPMERGRAVASMTVPPEADFGWEKEVLVWVRGCHDHFLRWTVRAARRFECSCEEVCVEDCPDYLHHWYDHFYCDHPCIQRG